MKGPATRNTLVKYESPGIYQSEVKTKVKVFKMKVKLHGQRSKSWYQMKGPATRNTHVKYESSGTYQSEVMTKVKVFADGRPDRQTDRVITIGHPQ